MAFGNFINLSTANFQLHATASVIYTATSSAEVVSVELHNANTSAIWCQLYYPVPGTIDSTSGSFRRLSETLSPGATLEYKRTPIPLQNGESIYGIAQSSGSINVSVIGRVS